MIYILKDWKLIYWLVIFSLFLLPSSKSMLINLITLVNSLSSSCEYKRILSELNTDNKKLVNKVKHYKTKEGLNTYLKESLEKVEDGELLIKYNGKD